MHNYTLIKHCQTAACMYVHVCAHACAHGMHACMHAQFVRSKYARSNLEAFSLQPKISHYSQHTARMQHAAGSYMPDLTSPRIWFCSSKAGPDHIVQNWPGFDLDGLVRFWPNASGPEASQCVRITGPSSGGMQLAHYQFPTFRLNKRSPTDSRDQIVQNQRRSDLVLADCIRFWPNGSGLEASHYARIIRPTCGQCS